MGVSLYQSKLRKSVGNEMNGHEKARMDALFAQVESELGLPSAVSGRESRKKQLERMLTNMNATKNSSSTRFCRGEIYYIVPEGEVARDGSFTGGRPGIIVSNDMSNEIDGLLEVVYLTTHPRNQLPTNVPINATGMQSLAVCNQIYTVSKKRVGKFAGQVSDNELSRINDALVLSLALTNVEKTVSADVLNAWKQEIEKGYSDIQLSDLDETDEELLAELQGSYVSYVAATVPTKEPVAKTEVSNETVTNESTVVHKDTDVSTSPEYIRAVAERDIYKQLYTDLLKTMSHSA